MKNALSIFLLICSLFPIGSYAQETQLTWQFLSDNVEFTEKRDKELEMFFYFPTFSATLKKIEGKKAMIRGYVVASDPEKGVYVLSRYPMAQCYFCGGAGPDSIMEIHLASVGKRYKIDQNLILKGTLKLNATDIEHSTFILEEAEAFEVD